LIEICRDDYIAGFRARISSDSVRAPSRALGFAHQTNEEVSVDALIKATTFYAAILQTILETTRKHCVGKHELT